MDNKEFSLKSKNIPDTPGVYFFKNKKGKIIYIGKANNLRARTRQYFTHGKDQHPKIKALAAEIASVDWLGCASPIDALIEEAKQIKKYLPKFNVLLRDDKNYFFVGVTREDYPCIFLTHQPLIKHRVSVVSCQLSVVSCSFIGPFTGGKALKEALKLLRRIFPFRYCRKMPKRLCQPSQLVKEFSPYAVPKNKSEIKKNIRVVVSALKGEKQNIVKKLERQMLKAARSEKFNLAEKYKNQAEYMRNIFAHRRFLEELPIGGQPSRDWSRIQKQLSRYLNIKNLNRVEGYDISNIGGQYAVGSMAVFIDGLPDKSQYRKFKIKYSGETPDDPKMMAEILARRMRHTEWSSYDDCSALSVRGLPTPDLIVVDGGITQLNAARAVLPKNQPVISLAKKEEEIYAPNRPPIHAARLGNETKLFLQHLRDEAHRFALTYHRKLRENSISFH